MIAKEKKSKMTQLCATISLFFQILILLNKQALNSSNDSSQNNVYHVRIRKFFYSAFCFYTLQNDPKYKSYMEDTAKKFFDYYLTKYTNHTDYYLGLDYYSHDGKLKSTGKTPCKQYTTLQFHNKFFSKKLQTTNNTATSDSNEKGLSL